MSLNNRIILLTVPLILLPSLVISFFPGRIIIICIVCLYPLLLFYFHNKIVNKSNDGIDKGKYIVNFFFLFNVLTFIRGVLTATTNDDWKNLLGASVFIHLLFPLLIYFVSVKNFYLYIRSYIKYGLIVAFIIYFNGAGDGASDFPHMLGGLFLIVFMLPFLSNKWHLFVISIIGFALVTNLGSRTNIINTGICFLILSISHLVKKRKVINPIFKFSAILLWCIPVLFLYLGITNTFNIFKIGELWETSYTLSGGLKGERNLLIDSRTSIYKDVFAELDRQKAYFWGLGGNGKTQTSLTDISYGNYDIIYKEGRRKNESGMLSMIQYGGICGFVAYYFLMVYASYLAIWKSKNNFIQSVGLWVAYKVLLSFIEDSPNPNIYYFFIIMAIGLCYNKKIRSLNNIEIKFYINLITQNVLKKIY